MKAKRIILVGPTCSGKNFIREKFVSKGFHSDVSYTTRNPREGEKNGKDYHFISKKKFERMIEKKQFYEYVKYGDNYYGTGLKEWNSMDVFIMETDGISKISKKDRKSCIVMFINTPTKSRIQRMRKQRKWDNAKIAERFDIDNANFKDFTDFDIMICNEDNTNINIKCYEKKD
jgi:guanylate kinase